MDVALVDSPGGGGPRSSDQAELVRLPSAVEEFVRLGLDGPGAPSLIKHRVLVGLYAAFGLAVGVLLAEALRRVDESPQATMAGALMGVGFGIGWPASSIPLYRYRRILHDEPNGFLAGLLRAELSPEGAAKVAADLKMLSSETQGAVVGLVIWAGLPAWALHTFQGGLNGVDMAALGLALVSSPAMHLCNRTRDFIPMLACTVVADRVKQVTRRVKLATPATADYSSLLVDIVSAEASVSAVSALLARTVQLAIGCAAAWTFACCFVPFSNMGPSEVSHWWNRYHWPYLFLIVGSAMVFWGVENLRRPATVTTACEELMDAINSIREKKEPGEISLQMPANTVDTEAKIDYLLGYVKNKNRRRGESCLSCRCWFE
jgi:hypothetical protein